MHWDPRGAVAAMPLGKCPVLCSSYETERKKALRAMETQWIFYPECNMYSNSKNHNISSRQERHGWLKAAEALCCSFIVIVFVPIADVLRLVKKSTIYCLPTMCSYEHTHIEEGLYDIPSVGMNKEAIDRVYNL